MKNKKISLVLAAMLAASSVVGCAGSSTSESSSTEASTESSLSTNTTEGITQTSKFEKTTEAETTTEEETTTSNLHQSKNGIDTIDDGNIHSEMTAIELAYLMGNGINLGNTLEAYGHKSLGVSASPTSYETLWGQPITTQEMISGMKAAGFDTIRIPVAWTNMMDFENDDYTIDSRLLDRVEEVINYAINEDMYVIINDHWDGGWWGMFGSANPDLVQRAWNVYEVMWTQICDRYKEYGNHLIFESANEELGSRLNDNDYAEDSGNLSKEQCYELVNQINQKFVDIVRYSGGNNADRFLLLAGYDTNIELTCVDSYQLPLDSAQNKLMVSVHYYTPSNYCLNNSTVNQWGTAKEYENMFNSFGLLARFTSAGIPCVIGEYGVLTDGSYEKKNTTDWIGALLDLCDYLGCVPCLWDCSTLYSRADCAMKFDDTKELFKSRSFAAQSSRMTQQQEKDEGIKRIQDNAAAAPASFNPNALATSNDTDKAVAWIMWNSGDWALSYSVGDTYSPDSLSAGVIPTDILVTGEGTYTISTDFTEAGGSNGVAFSAVGLFNGEWLYPGYFIEIISIKINGMEYQRLGDYYTTSDDTRTQRVNLYNSWVAAVPESARRADGNIANATPRIIAADCGKVNTIEITFDYVAPESAEIYCQNRAEWAAR